MELEGKETWSCWSWWLCWCATVKKDGTWSIELPEPRSAALDLCLGESIEHREQEVCWVAGEVLRVRFGLHDERVQDCYPRAGCHHREMCRQEDKTFGCPTIWLVLF